MTQHVTSKSNTKELYVNIGKRLKQIRLNKGYTQEEFSEIIEISPAYYGKIERGCHGLSLEKLILLHEKLDVDLTYVLTGNINSTLIFDKILEECYLERPFLFDMFEKLKEKNLLTKTDMKIYPKTREELYKLLKTI